MTAKEPGRPIRLFFVVDSPIPFLDSGGGTSQFNLHYTD